MTYLDINISEIEFLPKPTVHNFIDLEGCTFGRLTVLGFAGRVNNRPPVRWWCQCECGTITRVGGITLRMGTAKSCGCQKGVKTGRLLWKHGRTRTPEFRIWAGMRSRCNNPHNHKFQQYGGRGISVCERWNEFTNFFKDMGERLSPKHSIERIDNNGNYTPENCQWATPKEQMNNQQKTRMIAYQGRIQSLAIWCNELNLPRYRTYKRIYIRGWSIEKAFTEPQHKNKYV